MDPQMVSQLVRVRLLHGPEDLLKRVKHLKVRAEIVRLVAKLYIERHVDELRNSPSVCALLRKYKNRTVKDCLIKHAFDRLAHFYPDDLDPLKPTESHHGVIKEMQDVVEKQCELQSRIGHRSQESMFEMKNATMPDAKTQVSEAFVDKRPILVLDEAKTEDALPHETILKYGLGSIAELQIPMSRDFDDQWTSSYLPMIFPCSPNYRCGGAEYPDLFSNWDNLASDAPSKHDLGIESRWRRKGEDAIVTPGIHAQMLATRAEAQLAGDWMLVPACRNLHWRYAVLHSAF